MFGRRRNFAPPPPPPPSRRRGFFSSRQAVAAQPAPIPATTPNDATLAPGAYGPPIPDGSVRNIAPQPVMKKGGKVSSASKRADGAAQRGKTKGKML